MSSIFSKIIDRQVPADILYEDELCIAFLDKYPKAPVHFLVVPKKEIPTLDDATEDVLLLGHLMSKIPPIAKKMGLHKGYKVHIHCKEAGGQEIYHLHIHVTGTADFKES